PEDRAEVLRNITLSVEERRPDYQVTYRIVRPDGQTRWLQATGRLFLDADGAPQRMVGVCTDITERLELERRAKQAEEAAWAARQAELRASITSALADEASLRETLERCCRLIVDHMGGGGVWL